MPDESSNAELSLEEQLVAYLDGELDAESSRRIEEMLANDPQVRGTLQQLDRTWELLDELDRPAVGDGLTQTTLEMVTVAAAEDVRRSQAAMPAKRRRRFTVAVGSLAAAGLAGFLAVSWLSGDPNRQLVEDLPVLMNEDLPLLVNFEQHRIHHQEQDDFFKFLQMLSEKELFVEELEEKDELEEKENPREQE